MGLAACTTALNSYLSSKMTGTLSGEQLSLMLQFVSAIEAFPLDTRHALERVYGEGYDLQMKVLLAFAVLQLPVILLTWRNPQLGVHGH
jgi:hypothetical protein